MIKFKSIAEQRLDCAFKKVQEVIRREENYLSEEERQMTPAARKTLGKGKPGEAAAAYHQYVKSFAMLVLNNGLVAALLFAQGKANKRDNKGKAYELIIGHLTAWLQVRGHTSVTDTDAIKELYTKKNSAEIRIATLEAIRFLEDLKRVADARLYKPDEKTESNG